MAYLDDESVKKIGPPEVAARKIRTMYPTFFLAPAVCTGSAVYFAAGHFRTYAAAFALSALVLFPLSWKQYRNSKKIYEDAFQKYQTWYQEQKRDKAADKKTQEEPNEPDD